MKCDLVVVGAGPAGSMTAKVAAEAGLNVVMLEKRQEIGDPVRCAEGVSKAALKKLVEPDPVWVSAEVKGARIRAPDGTEIVMSEMIVFAYHIHPSQQTQGPRNGGTVKVGIKDADFIAPPLQGRGQINGYYCFSDTAFAAQYGNFVLDVL